MSKSATKALRGGIGGEKRRGVSTFLFARSGAIGAFVADLDNQRRRGPREGRRGMNGDRGGRPLTPRRAFRTRKCSSNRRSRVQNAHLEGKMHISRAKCTSRRGRGRRRGRRGPRPRPGTSPVPVRRAQLIRKRRRLLARNRWGQPSGSVRRARIAGQSVSSKPSDSYRCRPLCVAMSSARPAP